MLTGPHQTLPFRERMILRAVQMKAQTGVSMARNMPTLKQLRASYGITAKTWAEAAQQMPDAIEARIEALEAAYGA